MIPLGMTAMGDGVLVVGRSPYVIGVGGKGWAIRTDASGHVVWRYERAPPRPEVEEQGPHRGFDAEVRYVDAISEQNGEVWLCGSIVHNDRVPQPVVITELDRNGRLIRDLLVTPKGDNDPNIYSMATCRRWGDQIVVVAGAAVQQGGFFWIFGLDPSGAVRWERRLSPLPASARAGAVASVQARAESDGWNYQQIKAQTQSSENGRALFVLLTDGSRSELEALDGSGNPVKREAVAGRNSIVVPEGGADDIMLEGDFSARSNGPSFTTYDENLRPKSSRPISDERLTQVLGGYRQPDGSIFLIGVLKGGGYSGSPATLRFPPDRGGHTDTPLPQQDAKLLPTPLLAASGASAGDYIVASMANRAAARERDPSAGFTPPSLKLFISRAR